MRPYVRSAGVAAVIGFAGLATAAAPDRLPNAALEITRKYPGVRAELRGERVSMVYGRAMTQRPNPLDAADAFVLEEIGVFGVGVPELQAERAAELLSSPSTIVVYEQSMDGVPVERSALRVVVKTVEGRSVVAMASARLTARPEGGFRVDQLTAKDAVDRIAADPAWAGMQEFSEPEMVVYAGEGDEAQPIDAVRAWKFWGRGPGLNSVPFQRIFFVDASNGNLAFARDAVMHGTADVTGTVRGFGSPGLLPDVTSNPAVLLDIPEIRASITGGNNAFTDLAGAFTIDNALAGPLTVMASVTTARWVAVSNSAGTGTVSASVAGVTPPGPVNLVLNPTPGGQNSFTTSQVNAAIHQTRTHNYFRDRAPSFTALDVPLPANVNINDTCNAFFDGISVSTNFFVEGESSTSPGTFCVNSAYSSVVGHEYGHFIVQSLGLAQGAFGEGFSDCVAMLTYDDPIIARDFFFLPSVGPIRNPEAANVQYPCSGGSHFCGQILGGTFWDMRNNFVGAYGQPLGLELVRQLHVDWAQVTAGGIGSNSAHPQTAVEVLTIDDNDADLDNGTPNYALICDAFSQHSIACPQVLPIRFEYPAGRPELVSPTGSTLLNVNLVPLLGAPAPNSGELFYSVDSAPFTMVPMTENMPNQYSVQMPAAACGSNVRFYLRAGLQGGGTQTDPPTAPADTFAAFGGTSFTTLIDAAESAAGWSLGVAGDTANFGLWTFGNPNGTAAQPEDDRTPDPGVNCFFTGQGTPGGTLGEQDVDNGFTTLVSPPADLSAAVAARISYWRWYSNTTGADPQNDIFTVDVSNDGTNWVRVETIGPTGPEVSGGWTFHSFVVEDFVPLSANVRVRFRAEDAAAGSLIEAAVDDFVVERVECAPPPVCFGDANRDGSVNFLDVTTVLAQFGGAGPQGDADFDGDVDFGDATAVLANFLDVCP
jgi:hypothetical protein